jgi:hypothetical protein
MIDFERLLVLRERAVRERLAYRSIRPDAWLAVHFYRPGERTSDALAACLTCGASPTAEGFAFTHAPSGIVS